MDRYPVFLKPDRGQGAQRAEIAIDRAELEMLRTGIPTASYLSFFLGVSSPLTAFPTGSAAFFMRGAGNVNESAMELR